MSTTFTIYMGAGHQCAWMLAFQDGLRKHGITPKLVAGEPLPETDVVVFWGTRRKAVLEAQRAAGRQYIVVERGYFKDRMQRASVGWNGLNGLADFRNAHSPSDRWLQLGFEVLEWQTGGDRVVLGGQVPGDMTCEGVDLKVWYREAVEAISAQTDLPIYFKPHPMARAYEGPQGVPVTDTIAGAAKVVVYSSNLAVDAVMRGVPTVVVSPVAMAWPVTGHGLEAVGTVPKPERAQWLADLAYAQWTLAEIRAGECWAHLRSGLERG